MRDLVQLLPHFSDFETTSDSGLSEISTDPLRIPAPKQNAAKVRVKSRDGSCERIKKNFGTRTRRRMENDNFLRNLAMIAEIEECDQCVCEDNDSAFTQLFEDTSCMDRWNYFVGMTEEQQEVFLYGGENEGDKNHWNSEDVSVVDQDRRKVHPGAISPPSPHQSYLNIRRHLRQALSGRLPPLGFLDSVEDQLRSHFRGTTSCRDSTNEDYWKGDGHLTSYQRLLIHAVAQYLGLHSESEWDCQSRIVIVNNPQSSFVPPSLQLATYLECRRMQSV